MLSTPRYISNSFSVIFPRQQDIRRKANALEDELINSYSQPQIFPIPDDMDAEVPRIIFGSRHGFSQIVISQVSCSLNVTYSPDWQLHSEKGKEYLLERASLLFDLLRIAGINKISFSGLATQVNLPSDESEAAIISHVAQKLLKDENTIDLHDIEVKRTYIVDDKYFSNMVIANYRSWQVESLPTGVLSLSRGKATERGVRVTCDFNDRYSYNETEGYTTKQSSANTIIMSGLEAVQRIVTDLEKTQ